MQHGILGSLPSETLYNIPPTFTVNIYLIHVYLIPTLEEMTWENIGEKWHSRF
jgi:hypothetical protein